jgi:hypothetical protein
MAASPGGVVTLPSEGSGVCGVLGDCVGNGLGASDGTGLGSVEPPEADDFDDDPDVVVDTKTAMRVATRAMATRVRPVQSPRLDVDEEPEDGQPCWGAVGQPCWDAGGNVQSADGPGGGAYSGGGGGRGGADDGAGTAQDGGAGEVGTGPAYCLDHGEAAGSGS